MTATSNTVAHDSAVCTRGFMGQPCLMCQWAAERERQQRIQQNVATVISDNNFEHFQQQLAATIEQSAATIHARRRALLERAAPNAPTDGAVVLAHAYLADESWFQRLPDNAAEDDAVDELAQAIEGAIGNYLIAARAEYQREQRRLREDG
jgi:hypothetical protein